jgi:hypothetical protein
MSTLKVSTISPLGTDATKTITIGSASNGDVAAGVFTNVPSFDAQLSSNQSLSNDTWTKAQLSNEIYDTNNAFDSSTNYRFTVPTGLGGKYLFQYCALIADINDAKRGEARFYKNGSAYSYGRNNNMSSGTGASLYCTGSAIILMNAGDYLELYVYQNNGNDQAVYSSATFLSGSKIIGA